MSSGSSSDDARLLTVILFCAIGAVLAYGFWQQTKAIRKLDKTDKIACAFINADSTVRAKQAKNSAGLLLQQSSYVASIIRARAHTQQVIGLFAKAPTRGQTAKQRANTELFVNYLLGEADLRQAQRAVEEARENTTRANLKLTRGLVTHARSLATELHC